MNGRTRNIELELQQNVESFARRWGPIEWRDDLRRVTIATPDISLGRIFWTLSSVEDEAAYMRAKIHWARADRLASIRDFNTMWLAEEAEHARALAAMACAYGYKGTRISHATFFRDRRSIAGAAAVRAGSVYEAGMLGSYLTLAAMQEHTALTTYNAVGDLAIPAEMKQILRRISRQEGRHMRFYKYGALAVFDQYPMARSFARQLILRAWRPVGIDLLGLKRWKEIFFPVLYTAPVLEKLMQVDSVLASIVERRTPVMQVFLERQGGQ
jgi:hypothetical protein